MNFLRVAYYTNCNQRSQISNNFRQNPANIHLFNVNNRNNRTISDIY